MDPLMISQVALWIVVCVLSLLVFALMRQIGVLNERVFPAGALMTTNGPNIGEDIPVGTYTSLGNTLVHVGGPQQQNTLLLFVSPNCPICKTLLPYVQSVAKAEHSSTRIILASDADNEKEQEQHREFVKKYQLSAELYLLSRPLGLAFRVEKLPFAVIIDERGILRAKGMVNSREHLESLFEAQARGVASLQQHLLSQP
jgi:methylamine dehydrogenase accessory protein MauD